MAIGDPQAPLETFFALLDAHGLRDDDGRVAPDVHLVVMGDYFDWGARDDRERARQSGRRLLEWLAAHPREQVTLLLGNHDLARVGELAHLDDDTFRRAQAEADCAYLEKRPVRPEREFSAATGLASWETAARDFATFDTAQRELVVRLLREGRFDVAYAPAPDLLLTHAGVTRGQLERLGLDPQATLDARAIRGGARARARRRGRRVEGGPVRDPGPARAR